MHETIEFLTYLLSIIGLTILIVWPQHGPSAWLRDRVVRPLLPAAAQEILDCYICCSFWCGHFLSPAWWFIDHAFWCWTGCLIAPAVFWFALGKPTTTDETDEQKTFTETHDAANELNSQAAETTKSHVSSLASCGEERQATLQDRVVSAMTAGDLSE